MGGNTSFLYYLKKGFPENRLRPIMEWPRKVVGTSQTLPSIIVRKKGGCRLLYLLTNIFQNNKTTLGVQISHERSSLERFEDKHREIKTFIKMSHQFILSISVGSRPKSRHPSKTQCWRTDTRVRVGVRSDSSPRKEHPIGSWVSEREMWFEVRKGKVGVWRTDTFGPGSGSSEVSGDPHGRHTRFTTGTATTVVGLRRVESRRTHTWSTRRGRVPFRLPVHVTEIRPSYLSSWTTVSPAPWWDQPRTIGWDDYTKPRIKGKTYSKNFFCWTIHFSVKHQKSYY